ncbi:hypothetical protein SteCoe_12895 [Stentor coeruleus]|uniref:CSC1/OSCA1-like 7TM region domain-containing protein n=1 Tax=Stentor coeruleus TaxID=5963 RepID=A0A1R2C9Q9_9CILI|nr:hypothetical protein SteCoe_12895 [Stentor coeruleus]
MDSSVYSILTAALFDSILFSGLFCAFLFYRKLRSPVIESDEDIELRKPFLHEGKYDFLPLVRKINEMSSYEIYSSIGEWGFIYLTLHRYIIYVFAVMCSLGCGILLFVYSFGGDTNVDDTFHVLGISHIIEQPGYLIAPIIFIFVFTFALYTFAAYYYDIATHAECEDINPPQRYCLVITRIPTNFPPEFLNFKILKMLQSKYGSGVLSVYTIPYFQPSYKLFLELEEARQKLRYYEYDFNKSGKRPETISKSLKKVDAITYYEKKIAKLITKTSESKIQGLHTNSGRAYIICESQKLIKEIIDFRVERDPVIKTEDWRFKAASNPADINWQNVGQKKKFGVISKFLYNFIFLGLFLILLTPTSFNSLIQEFFDSIGASELLEGIVGVYLPSLLLLIYQQVILPEAVEFLVEREKHAYKHDEVSSGLRKYLFYLVFYIFLYPLLGLKFIELIGIFFESDNDWQKEFADSINAAGQFFTIFLVHETFVKNGWDLMVSGKYFKSKAKALLATTDAEKLLAYQADFFKFDLELAISINVLIIACSFSVVYPIILIPALSFFTLRYFVHKHNLLAVFYVDRNSSAYPTLFTVLCGIAAAVFSMQVLTAATLILSKVDNFSLFAKIMAPGSFCLLVLSILWFKVIVKRGRIEFTEESERILKVDISQYHHPMEKVPN